MKRPSTTMKITKGHVQVIKDFLDLNNAGVIVRHKGVDVGVVSIFCIQNGIAVGSGTEGEIVVLSECTMPRLTLESLKADCLLTV